MYAYHLTFTGLLISINGNDKENVVAVGGGGCSEETSEDDEEIITATSTGFTQHQHQHHHNNRLQQIRRKVFKSPNSTPIPIPSSSSSHHFWPNCGATMTAKRSSSTDATAAAGNAPGDHQGRKEHSLFTLFHARSTHSYTQNGFKHQQQGINCNWGLSISSVYTVCRINIITQ